MWSIQIEKMMSFINGKWVPYENKVRLNYYLRVHFDQIFISQDDKILENLGNKLKGYFKDNVLILLFCDNTKKIRKIRFQIKADDINACIEKLGHHFPLLNHKQLPGVIQPTFITLEEVFNRSINSDQNFELEMPPNYEDYVKLCILDPSFPQVLAETQKILEKISK